MSEYFYKMIKSMRLDKKVSQKQLSNGLCSVSLLSYIEKGEKIPSFELRQRLLDRLGGSFQSNINIFKGKEYLDRKVKSQLIKLIKEENWSELQTQRALIEERLDDSDTISQQFYYDVLGLISISEDNYDDAKFFYEKAVVATMSGISKETLEQYILAPMEYYYLIMYCFCQAKAESNKREDLNAFTLAILEKIEKSEMAETKRCGIYSFALVKYFEIVKSEDYFNILLLNDKVDNALSMLIRCNRSFNLMGLFEMKVSMFERMKAEKEKELYENRIEALNEIYRIAEVKNNTNCGVYFLYDEVSIDISDMIRKRRMLLGLTQAQLAEGICSVKTLRRIEQGIVNSQYAVIEPLLQRLGLSGERQYDNFVTEDWDVLRTTHEYKIELRAENFDKAKWLLSELEQKVEKLPQNLQFLKMEKGYLDYRTKVISYEEYLALLDEALCLTIQLRENTDYKEVFFTEKEIECLFNMATIREKYKSIDFMAFFSDFFNGGNGKNLSKGLQALILRWLSERYEKEGDYILSDKYAKMALRIDLLNNKFWTARKSLYDIAWNSVKSGKEQDMYSQEIYRTIFACVVLSEFIKDESGVNFLNQKLDIIREKKGDWTV